MLNLRNSSTWHLFCKEIILILPAASSLVHPVIARHTFGVFVPIISLGRRRNSRFVKPHLHLLALIVGSFLLFLLLFLQVFLGDVGIILLSGSRILAAAT